MNKPADGQQRNVITGVLVLPEPDPGEAYFGLGSDPMNARSDRPA